MQNTIRMIVQLISAVTEEKTDIHQVASRIAVLADNKDKELVIAALGELSAEMQDENAAYSLCSAMAQVIAADNGVAIPGFPPYALEAIGDLAAVEVQEVSSNGKSNTKRFYTEDCSERNWDARHHLIDLDTTNGKDYLSLRIHQFSRHEKDSCTIDLACNEVEELLSIALNARLTAAKEDFEQSERWRQSKLQPATSDDFDPFLTSDDLP